MVEDLLLDKQGENPNNTHMLGFKYLTKIKQTYNLIAIWWKENPDKTLFICHNKNQLIHNRIDRIYTQHNQKNKNVPVIPNSLSNHDVIKQ